MQTLIRSTLDKPNTCVALAITQSAPLPPISSPFPVLGSKSLPRRSQLYCGRHGTRSINRVDQAPTKGILMMTSSESSSVLIALLSLLLLLAVAVIEIDGLTPEDVRFAKMRCQNDSTDDPSMRLQWSMRMFPDNNETHCYVKCLLSKLGLINLKYRGLDADKFIQPLENQDVEISEECFTQLEDMLSGTCESYYRKWMELTMSCKEFFYIVLFDDPREVDKFNKLNVTQSKQLGETASEFCSKGIASSENKELTSEQTLGDDILSLFKCELGCVFQHIRYFDAYGRIDQKEILLSFGEANSNSKSNTQFVRKCVHRANSLFAFGPCQMAYELYQCLMKKIKNFKEIYAQRDKISRYY